MKFTKGDRVKLLKGDNIRDLVKLGEHGLVVEFGYDYNDVLGGIFYDVLFDGEAIAYLVGEDEIEVVEDDGLSLLSLVTIIKEDVFENKNVTGTITDTSCDNYGKVTFEICTPFNGKVNLSIEDFVLKEDD